MNKFFNKQNLPLIMALAIPVIMIVAVALAIYLPGMGKKPQYSFLYLSGQNVYPGYSYGREFDYVVKDGKLEKDVTLAQPDFYKTPQPSQNEQQYLYVYDVKTNSSREVTFQEAEKLSLDPSTKSSDNYEISRGSSGGGFLFSSGSGDYNSWYIRGYNRSTKLNLKLVGSYYDNFRFLGWIK